MFTPQDFKGDGHHYEIDNVENGSQSLDFIFKEERHGALHTSRDGVTNETLIGVLIHRIGFLNEKMPNNYNAVAIVHLGKALDALKARTKDREDRGVEGTPNE